MLAGERRHVLDDAGHPEMTLAGHVGRTRGHLLGGERWGGDDEDLGPRQHPGQAHLDVAGAGRHVDEEVVELAPADVLQELLDGAVQDEAPPHDGRVLVGQKSHGDDLHQARAHGQLEGDDLLGLGLQLALHAEQPGDGEAPDVGVEDAHGQAPAGQGHCQVDGDRGLAHPALARGDRQYPRRRGDVGGEGPVLLGLQPGPVHQGGALGPGHLAQLDAYRGDPGEAAHPGLDVRSELGPKGTAGDGEGHLHIDLAVAMDGDGPEHAEIDDVVAELGIDDPEERGADRRLSRRGGRCGHGIDRTGGLERFSRLHFGP